MAEPEDTRPYTHTSHVYEAAEPLLPARTWKENPLIWIAVVVAVFMAVPFLADRATRGSAARPKAPAVAGASAPAAASAPAERAAAPAAAEPTAVATEPAAPARALAEPVRQMITKCLENGRVVYTQTGACAGSVTAVPIDTSKNVVGPNAGASH